MLRIPRVRAMIPAELWHREMGKVVRAILLALAVVWTFGGAVAARAEPHPLRDHDVEAYKAAFKSANSNHWSEAKAEAARATDKILAKVIDWLYVVRATTDASFDTIAAFLERNPDWPKPEAVREHAEDAMPDDMPPGRVRRYFERFPPRSATGRIRYAEALLATGEERKGLELLRQAWINGNLGEKQAQIFLKKHRHQLRPEDNVARLDRLLWDGQERAAHAMLRRVDKGHAALGLARLQLQAMGGGVDYAIRRVPRELLSDPGLQFDRLRWRRRKGLDDEARAILMHPPADLVRPELWWQERAIQVHHAIAQGYVTDALRLAEHHGQKPGTSAYADAEWLAGWIALRQLREPALAFKHFANMTNAVRYPISRARGAYWEARALNAMGKTKEASADYAAAARYDTTYYGQLAALRLDPTSRPTLPPALHPTADQRDAFNAREMVRVVRALGQLGEEDLKEVFIKRLGVLARTPEDAELVADLAIEQTRPDLAVRLARQTWHSEMPLTAHGYPVRPLPSAISAEGALVLAVIRQESAFDIRAVSSAGALGLMQLMPATAKKTANGLGISYATNRLTEDPDYNVRVGSAYLAKLLDDFGGNYVLALAAYNAGPSRVHQWMHDNGDPRSPQVDMIDWIEMIPFDETRNYVQRVLEALQIYRGRLDGKKVELGLEQDMGRSLRVQVPVGDH
jgi:soluble lytic murein transglycosylase